MATIVLVASCRPLKAIFDAGSPQSYLMFINAFSGKLTISGLNGCFASSLMEKIAQKASGINV
jgi:hypothetical protein